tara:strand:- start:3933 stop:4178 length:246 start_codon:yes stop_codon:yes gene_type:complete
VYNAEGGGKVDSPMKLGPTNPQATHPAFCRSECQWNKYHESREPNCDIGSFHDVFDHPPPIEDLIKNKPDIEMDESIEERK